MTKSFSSHPHPTVCILASALLNNCCNSVCWKRVSIDTFVGGRIIVCLQSYIDKMTDNEFKESSFGFRSIRPKTREERRGVFDKVLLEKSRIDQRVGHEARLHQANAPANSSLLTSCVSEGAGYISNADRFHSDTAGEEYAARQEALQKKNRAIEFRRNQVIAATVIKSISCSCSCYFFLQCKL